MLTINFLFILRKSANYSVNRFFLTETQPLPHKTETIRP